jgi:hypothetical protein
MNSNISNTQTIAKSSAFYIPIDRRRFSGAWCSPRPGFRLSGYLAEAEQFRPLSRKALTIPSITFRWIRTTTSCNSTII